MLKNPLDPARSISAVLFDLDGTLYRQAPVRVFMALELLLLPLSGPLAAPKRLRALKRYRQAQEQFRADGGHGVKSIAAAQLEVAAAAADLPVDEVERLVNDWMLVRPLKYLRRSRASGVEELLNLLDRAGAPAGRLSDYPVASKLEALGLAGRFKPALCSTDPGIGALKPNPRGFLRACELWGLDPADVLMVGDRADVDAAGAVAAGMPCVIIGPPERAVPQRSGYLVLPSLERLRRVLEETR